VGPVVFFDHFGPWQVEPSDAIDVRLRPHIGLSTVTYLFAGALTHRDSPGRVQAIGPRSRSSMTAGRGISHFERRPQQGCLSADALHGLQLWVALSVGREAMPSRFVHRPAAAIAVFVGSKATVRVLLGNDFGLQSPVPTERRLI
jgi:redox-sensitive bicupin YhaK (pirin superfamily)